MRKVPAVLIIALIVFNPFFIKSTCSLVVPVASVDAEALYKFKSRVRDPQQKLTFWNSDHSCNAAFGWDGITCDTNGRVTSIDLREFGLSGSTTFLSRDFTNGSLHFLTSMDIAYNNFTGSFPSFLSYTPFLSRLDISHNSFYGGIPSGIGGFTNLTLLRVGYNSFHGPFPTSIVNLFNLIRLDTSFSTFTSPAPLSFPNYAHIEELRMSHCNLAGPTPYFGNLSTLKILDLSGNALTGGADQTLGALKNVQYLDLSENSLNGVIPSSFGQLKSLVYLNLASNYIKGVNLTFNNLKRLQFLNVSKNVISSTFPSSLTKLVSIQTIDISFNKFYGLLPTQLSQLPVLQTLNVAGNLFRGGIILSFVSPAITFLDFSANFFSGRADVSANNRPVPYSHGNTSGLLIARNCLSFTDCAGCTNEQRPASECEAFCNALQANGVCGGGGECISTRTGEASVFRCVCATDFILNAGNSTCIPFNTRTTGLLYPVLQNHPHLNKGFRHMSASFLYSQSGNLRWNAPLSWNWIEEFSSWAIRDQGNCAGCWAYAVIGAMESAVAITIGTKVPPQLSESQILKCAPGSGCDGGWPGDALEYASQTPILSSSVFTSQSSCPGNAATGYMASFYEEVNFIGWLGLMIAVTQQPVIVHIDASSIEFVTYQGGIFDSDSCYVNGINHAVLVVGFDFTGPTPYWIIRNQWGGNWGERGYMRLAIKGGIGICGINALPGLYPNIKKVEDQCNEGSFGVSVLGNFQGQPGSVNPCGKFPCHSSQSSSTCDCKSPFSAFTNIDGSQACILSSKCKYFPTNPCGVGACVDTALGSYTCVCPFGYALATTTFDESPTCYPAIVVAGGHNYSVPVGTAIDCSIIYDVYGISEEVFLTENPAIDCSKPVPGGTVVNVSSTLGACSLPYAVNQGDTAASIVALFSIQSLCGSGSPNPGIDCNQLSAGQEVCIIRGNVTYIPTCTHPYVLQFRADGTSTMTCGDIINNFFNGNAADFFTMNPGFYCDRLTAPALIQNAPPLQSVCLGADTLGSFYDSCYLGKYATAYQGATCQKIYFANFQNIPEHYKWANHGATCSNSELYVGFRYCTAWP